MPPGTPGGLMVMLAEFGTMSLKQVLEPCLEMAEGYPIEKQTADSIEREKDRIKSWPYSKKVLLPHPGEEREAPYPGEVFRQPDLLDTLLKLIEAEDKALSQGKTRKEAIYAAYERFYKGDIAREFVRGCQEQGGLIALEDLANWQVYLEEPVMTTYKGIEVYKLTCWAQGPVMLQTLNMLENIDLKKMGYNSVNYIHAFYQVMNLAFADRDFYYGDPYFPPDEPIQGLLSKGYAQERLKSVNWNDNDHSAKPGDPYPFEGKTNPYLHLLEKWPARESKNSLSEEERLALKDGRPFLSFSVQGGDTQDQNCLQFFLNILEFGMDVQEACEAPNIVSYQMHSSFGGHESQPGRLTLNEKTSPTIREHLAAMGYKLDFRPRTSGPLNAIFFDWKHGTFWGGSSNFGEDYGIAW